MISISIIFFVFFEIQGSINHITDLLKNIVLLSIKLS